MYTRTPTVSWSLKKDKGINFPSGFISHYSLQDWRSWSLFPELLHIKFSRFAQLVHETAAVTPSHKFSAWMLTCSWRAQQMKDKRDYKIMQIHDDVDISFTIVTSNVFIWSSHFCGPVPLYVGQSIREQLSLLCLKNNPSGGLRSQPEG